MVGATAREMLIAAAADMWKIDKATCRAENGAVIDATGKKHHMDNWRKWQLKCPFVNRFN